MEIDPQVREIPIASIQLIEWFPTRSADSHRLELDQLSASMKPITTPRSGQGPIPRSGQLPGSLIDIPSALHDTLDRSLLALPMGQLAPIRVLKDPKEVSDAKDYGLIFGYRRLLAAKQAGLATIHATIVRVSWDEYKDPSIRFRLVLMSFTENMSTVPLPEGDRIRMLSDIRTRYNALFPARVGKGSNPTNNRGRFTSAPSSAPPRFDAAAAAVLNQRPQRIREDLQLADRLNSDLLDWLTDGSLTRSAALALAKVSPEQQTHVLNALARKQQPLTTANIDQAISQITRDRMPESGIRSDTPPHAPSDSTPSPPDLTIFSYATRHAITLRKDYQWTPEAASNALQTVFYAMTALDLLDQQLKAVLAEEPQPAQAKAPVTAII